MVSPAVVPYVEWHTGARRVVTFELEIGNMGPFAMTGMLQRRISPTVHVDGRQFPVYWGRVNFEVPADRNVHVAVSLDDSVQVASDLLPAGGDLVLVYRTDASGAATLERFAA
ncbi:MAG: hypothetical protein ABJH68_18260 [Ilumatobacter sp.]|uniref:hypothetical protein n=1 Tax=Ilumatobacter sp. TaxID=1967498 RepID=UPI003298D58A